VCIYAGAEGRITYGVYADCRGTNNVYTRVASKMNHVSDFLSRYRSVQVMSVGRTSGL
jgi:hypothetical protein